MAGYEWGPNRLKTFALAGAQLCRWWGPSLKKLASNETKLPISSKCKSTSSEFQKWDVSESKKKKKILWPVAAVVLERWLLDLQGFKDVEIRSDEIWGWLWRHSMCLIEQEPLRCWLDCFANRITGLANAATALSSLGGLDLAGLDRLVHIPTNHASAQETCKLSFDAIQISQQSVLVRFSPQPKFGEFPVAWRTSAAYAAAATPRLGLEDFPRRLAANSAAAGTPARPPWHAFVPADGDTEPDCPGELRENQGNF